MLWFAQNEGGSDEMIVQQMDMEIRSLGVQQLEQEGRSQR